MSLEQIKKACIGEGLMVCDKCGVAGKVHEFYRIYDSDGGYVDFCAQCFEEGGRT